MCTHISTVQGSLLHMASIKMWPPQQGFDPATLGLEGQSRNHWAISAGLCDTNNAICGVLRNQYQPFRHYDQAASIRKTSLSFFFFFLFPPSLCMFPELAAMWFLINSLVSVSSVLLYLLTCAGKWTKNRFIYWPLEREWEVQKKETSKYEVRCKQDSLVT